MNLQASNSSIHKRLKLDDDKTTDVADLPGTGYSRADAQPNTPSACNISELPDTGEHDVDYRERWPVNTADSGPLLPSEVFPYEHIVFIDSTWRQCRKIYLDDRLKALKCLVLNTRNTNYWRFQREKPDTYLATIEAIYYFFVDYNQHVLCKPYLGQYDNLLYFFVYYYKMIHRLYSREKLRVYKEKSKQKKEACSTE